MQESQCKLTQDGETLAVSLFGELDHYSVAAIREKIDAALFAHPPKRLLLELSGVEFMDSAGLGLIFGRKNKVQLVGGELVLKDPTPAIRKILQLAGAERMIQTVYSVKSGKGGR